MSSSENEKRLLADDWAEFERQRPAKRAASNLAFSARIALEFLGALILVSLWTSNYDSASWLQTGTNWVAKTARGCHSRVLAGGANDTFDWESITPSAELRWTSCYGGKQCARFETPLDYSKPDDVKAAIALLKIPSIHQPASAEYRGPVLFNPGGPGGSGVDLVKGRGDLFAKILGNEFDIIGFDPRAVGHTTPKFSLYLSEAEKIEQTLSAPGLINSTADSLARIYEVSRLRSALVADESRNTLMGKHASTAVVARDMLEITKAHGWDELQYWGFSYGTVLGSTYAAMFPDNVGRLVIDGVVDAENYYATLWSNNLIDTEKTLQSLFDGCHAAGPSNCSLYEPTPALISARLTSLLTRLKTHPVGGHASNDATSYGVIDFSRTKSLIFSALYKPFAMFPPLVDALVALEKGNASLALGLANTPHLICPSCGDGKTKGDGDLFNFSGDDSAPAAIMCTDGEPVHDSLEDARKHFEAMSGISQFADYWSQIHMRCINWGQRAAWRFAGPFEANTSFPLLIIGNTADPVTPLDYAHKMSLGFPSSIVLTQDSPGHCSLSGTSLCTAKAVRSYFRDGVLPEKGTVCSVRERLFRADEGERAPGREGEGKVTGGGEEQYLEALTDEDKESLGAVKELSKTFDVKFPVF